jgi:hypothetical protein
LAALSRLASGRVADGAVSVEVGRDIAVRIRALQRALSVGRGTYRGLWISPLRLDDLARRMPALLDDKSTVKPSGAVVHIDVGEVPSAPSAISMDKVEGAVMDRLVDAAVTRALGEQWAAGLKEALAEADTEVTGVRATLQAGASTAKLAGCDQPSDRSVWGALRAGVADLLGTSSPDVTGCLCGYALKGLVGGKYVDMAQVDPGRVAALNRALVAVEVRCLAERILADPQTSAAELSHRGPDLLGALDPSSRRAIVGSR